MMAGQLVSPNNSMKIKNRNAARRIKNGSPKIREVLRQRCRERIHERRDEIFSNRRLGYDNMKNTLTDILREEFDNISASMEWAECFRSGKNESFDFEEEVLDIEETIEEQWILQEYEKMLWEQKEISSLLANDVMCPICHKNLLKETFNMVVCDCGLNLPVQNGLQSLHERIQELCRLHEEICSDVPNFSVLSEGENTSLFFSCHTCDTFSIV